MGGLGRSDLKTKTKKTNFTHETRLLNWLLGKNLIKPYRLRTSFNSSMGFRFKCEWIKPFLIKPYRLRTSMGFRFKFKCEWRNRDLDLDSESLSILQCAPYHIRIPKPVCSR